MFLSREYHARFSESRFYSLLIGLSAFVLMITALIPFETVLVPAVAARSDKWRRVWVSGSFGSALGAATLAGLCQVFGWPLVNHLIPSLAPSAGWIIAQKWMMSYGAAALVAIAALPIAQAPALVLCGFLGVPLLEILATFLVGKALKYGLISLAVLRGEARFRAIRKLLPPNRR